MIFSVCDTITGVRYEPPPKREGGG
eukprot:COSAG05_NODE_31738_length_100_cov_299.000000_1_plen_24_part_01